MSGLRGEHGCVSEGVRARRKVCVYIPVGGLEEGMCIRALGGLGAKCVYHSCGLGGGIRGEHVYQSCGWARKKVCVP